MISSSTIYFVSLYDEFKSYCNKNFFSVFDTEGIAVVQVIEQSESCISLHGLSVFLHQQLLLINLNCIPKQQTLLKNNIATSVKDIFTFQAYLCSFVKPRKDNKSINKSGMTLANNLKKIPNQFLFIHMPIIYWIYNLDCYV